MKLRKYLVGMLCLLAPMMAHAQLDSIAKARTAARRALNTTKLEIKYQTKTLRTTDSRGLPRESKVTLQLLSINGRTPVLIYKNGDILRRYYNRCWEAREILDEGNKHLQKARRFLWGGLTTGTALFFSGFIANPQNKDSRHLLALGLGATVMTTSGVIWLVNKNKGRELFQKSVNVYNEKCYAFPLGDTILPDAQTDSIRKANKEINKNRVQLDEFMYYDLLRNDPGHFDLSGIALNLANADVHMLNLNIRGGIGFFYTHQSKISVFADYQIAYLDNPGASKGGKNPPNNGSEVGGPLNYSKTSNLDITTAFSVKSWKKEGKYGLGIGKKRLGRTLNEVVGAIKGDVQKSIMLRLGYQRDNRLVRSETGIWYATNTPAYIYHHQGTDYEITPDPTRQSTIFKSGIITAGASLSSFHDLKIRLHDDSYDGIRQVRKQTDLYVDVMYAHQTAFQDMLYWSSLKQYTGADTYVPQRIDVSQTEVSKLGFRTGIRTNAIGKWYGLRTGAEAGIRPGPKVTLENSGYVSLSIGLVFGVSL